MKTPTTIPFSRYQKLKWELSYALDKTEKDEIKHWVKSTALIFPNVTFRRAKNIAEAVKIPKYIVGIKLEKIKIENPKMIVIVVKNTAFPIFE